VLRFLSVASAVILALGIAAGAAAYSAVIRPHRSPLSRPLTGPNCPASPGGSGLLPDGDFSQAPDFLSSGSTYNKGQTFAPLWRAAKGNVDFLGSTYWDMAGLCNVDLDGFNSGGIAHAGFATTPGVAYTCLSFSPAMMMAGRK
jgi:hypothetical protein